MRTVLHIIFLLIAFIPLPVLNAQDKDMISHNILFGTPPDSIPVVFAKGIVSVGDRYEYGLAISPDYNEIFFTAESPAKGLQVMKRVEKGDWTYPEAANLRGTNSWEFEAFYTFDGKKLYFSSDVNDTSRLWCSEKSEKGWNRPFLLKSPVNSTPVFWATVAKNSTMYYTNLSVFQIYKSKLTDGQYRTSEKGGVAFGIHPFISPEEDFILFNGKGDIYIAFRTNEGKWTEPVKLGIQICSIEYDETCPSLSPDGKYIFFSRYNDKNGKSDIYWVSSSIIERIRVKVIK
jgi:Tol biopolymer transport system component